MIAGDLADQAIIGPLHFQTFIQLEGANVA